MKALVTGAGGTVGGALCARLRAQGIEPVGWDRGRAMPGDFDAARALFDAAAPDVVFNLAMPSRPTGVDNEGWIVNEKWTGDIGRIAAERGVAMVHASTVMVWTNRAVGPFTPDSPPPDETEGYGHSKLMSEHAARSANPDARVVRLGWQIGEGPGGNNMVDNLERQMAEKGEVAASTRWMPATSFLPDTADALIEAWRRPPGTYLIDSNTRWNFHEIVMALNRLHGGRWNVRATEDFTYDQRMTDGRLAVATLDRRLELP